MMIVSVMIHVGKVKLMGPPPKITLLDLSILPRAGTCIQQWMESGKGNALALQQPWHHRWQAVSRTRLFGHLAR